MVNDEQEACEIETQNKARHHLFFFKHKIKLYNKNLQEMYGKSIMSAGNFSRKSRLNNVKNEFKPVRTKTS